MGERKEMVNFGEGNVLRKRSWSDSVRLGFRWVLRKEERRIKEAATAARGTASEDEKRTREIEGKEESMEGKKPPPSTSEELVLHKDASSSSLPPPPPGYFSSIFPPASTVMSKHWTLNKNCRAGAQTVNYPSGDADSRSQGTNDRDVKLLHPIESSTESSCFGSSVHYGGRDFYVSPPSSIDASEASKSYKHEGTELGNVGAATRGDWWQGSLYY